MADLQLVGAVAVRVRPDTKNFRRDAKREILAQLQDVEGEFDVRVKPNVKQEEADLRDAVQRAFKDITLDQPIKVKPQIDQQQAGKLLKGFFDNFNPEITAGRIKVDSAQAEENIAGLTDEVEDLESALSRLPAQLENEKEAFSRAFRSLEESTDEAQQAIMRYEDELEDLTATLKGAEKAGAEAAERRAQKMAEVSKLTNDLADDEAYLETLRERWREASGKAAKAEITRLKTLQQARISDTKKRIRDIKAEAREFAKLADQQEKERARAEASIEQITKRLRAQQGILERSADSSKDLNDAYEKQVVQVEETLATETERLEVMREQLEEEQAFQAARLKTNKELNDTLNATAKARRLYREALANGLVPSSVKSELDWLKRTMDDLTREQLADLDEINRRRAEGYEEAMQAQEAWAKRVKNLRLDTIGIDFDPHISPIAMEKIEDELETEMDRIARDIQLTPQEKFLDIQVRLKVRNGGRILRDAIGALTGVSVAQDIGQEFIRVMRNLDDVTLAATRTTMAIGTLTAAMTAGLGSASALATDLGELVGVLLMAPSAAFTLGTAIYTTMKGFENFGAAVDGDAEALASFGEFGRDAAQAMGVLKTRVEEVSRRRFWMGMEHAMGDMARAVTEPMVKGMGDAAEEVGGIWAGMFRSLKNFANSGGMTEAFENMNRGLRGFAEASEPFMDALNTIGLVGARVLPDVGQKAAEGARNFRDWAAAAEETGEMEHWIRRAGDHLDSLVSIAGSSVGIIGSLGDAADKAGFGGLSALAFNLRKVNEAAKGEFFQSNMSRIFDGALDSILSVASGLRTLGEAFLRESDFIEDVLEDIGDVVENSLEAVAGAFDNPRMQSGVREFFGDLVEASEQLGPIMDKTANGLGDIAGIAGEVVKGALNIADAFLTVWDRSENISASLQTLIPFLTDTVANFIELSHVPITILMDGLALLIDMFMVLPGPIQNATVALGALIALGAKFGPLTTALVGLRNAFGRSGFGSTVSLAARQLVGLGDSAMIGATRTERAFKNMKQSASTLGGGMKRGLSTVTSFLGGPWGLAFVGAGAVMMDFAQRAADTRARVEEITSSFDEFGNATKQTSEVIANTLNDMETHWSNENIKGLFKDLFGENGPETVGDNLKALGMTSSEVADMLVNDRGAYMELAQAMADLGKGIRPSEDALQRLSGITGISTDRLRELAPYLQGAGDNMLEVAENTDAARDSFTNLNGEVSPASQHTQELADAFGRIADEASPAAERVEALNDALALMRGEDIDADEAIGRMHEQIRNLAGDLPGLVAEYGNFMDVIGDDGKINTASEAGFALQQQLQDLGDAAKLAYMETGDISHLEDAKNGFITTAQAAGLPKEAVDELSSAWDRYVGSPAEVKKTVEISGGMAAIDEVEGLVNTLGMKFDKQRFEAWLEADTANVDLAVEDAAAAAEKFANDTYLADLGVEKGDFDAVMAEAEAAGAAWDSKAFVAWLNADPENAKLAAEDAKGAAEAFAKSPYNANLGADPTSALGAIYQVDGAMLQWDGKTYQADLDGNPAPFIQAKGQAEGEGWTFDGQNWVSTLDGTKMPFSTEKSLAEGEGLQFSGNVFTSTLNGNAAMFEAAKGAAESSGYIWDGTTFTSDLDGNNYPFIQKKGAADGVGYVWDGSTWVSTLDGDEIPASNAANRAHAHGRDWSTSRYSGSFDGDSSGAWSALEDAIAAGLDWARRTFTANFDGGVGGTFADGGIIKAMKRVQKFADGGFSNMELATIGAALNNPYPENHRAQISRPHTPFRIWAEPETGGEAYIPLATSKRARSTRIWEETGRRLGVDWTQYANGGVSGGTVGSSSSGLVRGAKVTNINIHNQYPVAEKTSVTVNKGLQFAANLG